VVTLLGAVVLAGFVYYVILRIAGLGPDLRWLRAGDPWRLPLGVLVEVISIAGEVALFWGVFTRPGNGVGVADQL
jgi:hypothetical protein